MLLIALSGKLGTGKDTAADILCNDYNFQRVSVGKYIRQEFVKASWVLESGKVIPASVRSILNRGGYDIRREYITKKPTPPDVREALQWFGQMMYIANPRHWIDQVVCEIRENGYPRVVFTDARMLVELETTHLMGGITVQITRHIGKIPMEYVREYPKLYRHVTETEMDEFPHDYILNNSDTHEKLKLKVDALMKDLRIS